MRVLHVIPALAARDGGPSTAVLGMCRALSNVGVDAMIAATGARGDRDIDIRYGHADDWAGARAIVFKRYGPEALKWSPALARWLRVHVREFSLVHVHAVLSHASLAAGAACRAAGVPYLVRPLGTLDPWSLNRHARRKQLLLALAGNRLLEGAAAIHYTSNDERTLAESRLPWLGGGTVVGLGIDDSCFQPIERDEPAHARIVLSMGRLHPKKRIDALIEAFHGLDNDRRFDPWRLVIAGDGEPGYVAALHRAAARGPAGRRIAFVGWVSGDRRLSLLRSSQLLVVPSHQENFGLALVEGLASGIPAIVTPGVNLAQEIASTGCGWLCQDLGDLPNVLRVALTEDDDRRRRGHAAQQFAERFRWTAVATSLARVYEDVLRGSRRRSAQSLAPAVH